MTALNAPVTVEENVPEGREAILAPIKWRDPVVAAIMTVIALVLALMTRGSSNISFSGATSWFDMGTMTVPGLPTNLVLTVIAAICTALIFRRALARETPPGWLLVVVGFALVCVFLIWMVAGEGNRLPVVSLLEGALMFAVPLTFGALSGVVNERSGIINIAIEGQLLFGAFAGALVGSMFHNPWMGLIGAPIAGMLIAVLLALFTIKYRADHIIVGVVLNMLALGLTSFLFSTLLKQHSSLNQNLKLPDIPIPILKDIPIIGPVVFNQSILVYAMLIAVLALQFMVFRSRWGLRMRAAGEHPKAADTVGIKVNLIRWQNVLLGGALAGLGGAFFTLGQGLAFSKDMAAGNGFIALAAMILGRWNPKGAFAAALLFGFATNMGFVMQAVGANIPSEFVLMIPYVITILAVAGFVGAVRAPAAEGKPYP